MRFRNYLSFVLVLSVLLSIAACKPVANEETAAIPSAQATSAVSGQSAPTPQTPTSGATNESERIPLIFSHDGAMDDIAALLYVNRNPNVKIIGVVNSYGEQVPAVSSQKWLAYLHEVLELDDVPLAVGSGTPLDPAGYAFPQGWRDAANDFWGLELPVSNATVDAREGYQLIIDLVNASPEKVTLLVTGAQTDVALALQHDPQIKENIRQIVIMGGAFYTAGNLNGGAGSASNDVAEWNIFVDALAAKQVFQSGIPLIIVPLDGSEDFWITKAIKDQLSGNQDKQVQFFSQLCDKGFELWGGDFLMWDILAAVAVTDHQYFSWENGDLDVISDIGDQHGQTVVVDRISRKNLFAVGNDYDELYNHILDVILER